MPDEELRIAGKKMAENAYYPWSLGSVARALFFFGQAQKEEDRRALSAIASYYSLFHLTQFLIFACPQHQSHALKKKIRKGVENGGDPSPEISHTAALGFLNAGVSKGLSPGLPAAVEKAQGLRVFTNYGPRVYWKGDNHIYVDTCAHSPTELSRLRAELPSLFRSAVEWACDNGEDGGVWVPQAIEQSQSFFVGRDRWYGGWCTEAEASSAESLRASLAEEARGHAFGTAKT